MPQVEPETQSIIVATTDLRGSFQAGNTVAAYATDQLINLGSAIVKSVKQARSCTFQPLLGCNLSLNVSQGGAVCSARLLRAADAGGMRCSLCAERWSFPAAGSCARVCTCLDALLSWQRDAGACFKAGLCCASG